MKFLGKTKTQGKTQREEGILLWPSDVVIMQKPNIIRTFIVLTGGPGSGKGTQCEKIALKFGFTHLRYDTLTLATFTFILPNNKYHIT